MHNSYILLMLDINTTARMTLLRPDKTHQKGYIPCSSFVPTVRSLSTGHLKYLLLISVYVTEKKITVNWTLFLRFCHRLTFKCIPVLFFYFIAHLLKMRPEGNN